MELDPGADGPLSAALARLRRLEPGFGGRLRVGLGDASQGPTVRLWWREGVLHLEGAGSAGLGAALAAEVRRQVNPWAAPEGDPGPLAVAIAPTGAQERLGQHIGDGIAIAAARALGIPFAFPCGEGYEERCLVGGKPLPAGLVGRALAETDLASSASAIAAAAAESGIDALALAAVIAWQTAWGTVPGLAVSEVAQLLRCAYLYEGGRYFWGANLTGVNVHFAVDPAWRHGVAAVWGSLQRRTASPQTEREGP